MSRLSLDKCWSTLLGEPLSNVNYWVEKCAIPIGTLKPYEAYDGNIPESDIVTIKFDPSNIPFGSRNALNILLLGGSGDGKTLLLKLIWSVLHDAKYFCAYVDPFKIDGGKARIKWDSKRLPPHLKPKGIELQHFMPYWSLRKYGHMAHNFRKYAIPLYKVDEMEAWQGLGMSSLGASKVASIIQREGKSITFRKIYNFLLNLPSEELSKQTYDNAVRILTMVEEYKIIVENNNDAKTLNMWNEWNKGNSIVFSYNNGVKHHMTFDIGMNIKESASYSSIHNNKNPIMWLLDDGSLYAKEFKNILKFNFAVQEILNIGFNYRGLGLNNCLSIQSLGIIDDAIAEAYKIKIISPKFARIDQLLDINVPYKAIQYLRDDILIKDNKNHLMQYLLITQDNEVVPFFPFTPPCNHFTEIYHAKKEVME